MKGEDIEAGVRWGGNPARPLAAISQPVTAHRRSPRSRAAATALHSAGIRSLPAAVLVALALPAGLAVATAVPHLTRTDLIEGAPTRTPSTATTGADTAEPSDA